MVASTQLAQPELAGSEVIKPRFEIVEGTTGEIEFNLIERAGARRRAEINLPAGVGARPCDAGREIEQLTESMEVGNSTVGLGDFRDRGECGDAGLPDLARQ